MRGPFDPGSRVKESLFVLSGLDGSGKSTQAERLAARMNAEGFRVRPLWNRWDPRLSAPVRRLVRKRLRAADSVSFEDDYTGFVQAKQRRMQSAWKRNTWQFMVWSEYICQVRWRLFSPGLRGEGLVCDRYIYDTLIDIAINFAIPPGRIDPLLDHPLLSLFPRPSGVIFIDIDPDEGAARKQDGTPPEYLADRRAYYHDMARRLDIPLVDGGAPMDEVSERIWELTGGWRTALKRTRVYQDRERAGS